jgi:hypothetical protein
MRIEWCITQADQDRVSALIEGQRHSVLVCDRRRRNLAERKDQVTKERLWKAIVCMRLTTQARSGPKGKLAAFQQLKPFPLGYDVLCKQKSLEPFILETIQFHGVGRHRPTISKQLTSNFLRLEDGEWSGALSRCNRLTKLERRKVEAEVADYLAHILDGFGPKQSRNVLQALGLTRFEIPIDSRVTDWLNDTLKFPFEVSAAALADRHIYGLVSDAICVLCEKCGEFPCILDAAIFGSKEGEVWMKDPVFY